MTNVQRINRAGWSQPPLLEVGEVVLGSIINGNEDPGARGKARPLVLLSNRGSLWRVAGLTTRDTYNDGIPRVSVPNAHAVGLNAPGYLWGEKLTSCCVLDIEKHLGWVDPDLARAIINLSGLDAGTAQALLDAASFHHPHAPRKGGSR